MSMSKQIIQMLEEIKTEMREMKDEQKKANSEMVQMSTTLYGAKHEKNGGLVSDVKDNTNSITNMKIWMAGIGSVAGALGGLIAKFLNW